MRVRLNSPVLWALAAVAWLVLSVHAAAPALRPQYVVDTLADLESLDPRVVSSGGRAHVGVRGRVATGDWGGVRWFAWNRTATNAVSAHWRTNVLGVGRWQSDDVRAPLQDPRWWGATGNGTTNDAPALNDAADHARAYGLGIQITRASVDYRCTDTVDFRDIATVLMDYADNNAANGGGIRTEASGDGVLIGGTTSVIEGGRYKLKVVRYPADWSTQSACVRVSQMQACDVQVTSFGSFNNLLIDPDDDDWVVYCRFTIGSLGWGRRNIAIEASDNGYANNNVFSSGQLTLARVSTNDPVANVYVSTAGNAQVADNVWREIDFNGRTDAFTNAAMFCFSPGATSVGGQYGLLGNRVENGRFEVGANVRVPLVRVLATTTNPPPVSFVARTMKYDTSIYGVVIPEGSTHYVQFEHDELASWVGEGNRRSLHRPIATPTGLPPLFVDGSNLTTFTDWGRLRAPGRTIYDLVNGRVTNTVVGPRIAAPGGARATFESTNFVVGHRFTRPLFRETFLRVSDDLPLAVIAFDTNSATLGGAANPYVVGNSWRAVTNGASSYYTVRGGWLWLHPDVASVVIGYNPWFAGSDVIYRDITIQHLFGSPLEWAPSGLLEQGVVTTGPPRTPQAVGSIFADASGLGYWQNLFGLSTTVTASGAFGTNTVFLADTTGVQTNDYIAVQTPTDTIGGLPRISVSQVTAVTATNVTVSPLMGTGPVSGATAFVQRWRFATNSWGSAAYRDVPSSGDANSQQAVLGSDSRLSDARTPVEHGHLIASITNASELGKILMGAADRFIVLTNLQLRAVGGLGLDLDAAAQLYFRTNYSTNIEGTAFRRINFLDTARIAFTAIGDPTSADEIVLSSDVRSGSITTNYLAAAAISYLLDRGSHTGSQAISTITGLQTALDQKQGTNAILTQVAAGNGSSLTNLNADGISSGTLADARIPSAIARDAEMALLYQPLDPSLTEIAGFSGIAGQMPYHDGTSFTPLLSTVAGRALLTAADAAAQRSSLGLGTAATRDVPSSGNASSSQAVLGSDTRLSDARTPTSHTHPASEISDSTTAGRALLTAANASAQRSSLGLGSLALVNDAPSDSTIYGRSNATWVPVSCLTGGGTSTSAPVALTLMVSTAAVTVTNSVTNETSLATSVTANSVTNLDAGTLTSGTLLRARLHGTLSAPSANYGGTLRFKVGGYTASILVEEPSSYTPDGVAWSAEVNVLVSASGSSATVRSWGTFAFQSAPYATANEVGLRHTTGSGTLNTTTTAAVSLTWANANPGMDLTCSGVVVEILGKTVSVAGRTYAAGAGLQLTDSTFSTAVLTNALATTSVALTNSTSLTNFASVVVPANWVTRNGEGIEITSAISWFNNSGSGIIPSFQLNQNGTNATSASFGSINPGAVRRTLTIRIAIIRTSSTAGVMHLFFHAGTSGPSLANSSLTGSWDSGPLQIDWGIAQQFDPAINMGTASASAWVQAYPASVRFLR